MCLIIFTRNLARARLRRSVLKKAFWQNSDGVGLSYIEDGVLKVTKGFEYFDDFYAAFRPLRAKIGTGACLIHFRNQSVGLVNEGNTQPVVIKPDCLVMAHNGTFEALKGDEESDSVRLGAIIKRLDWSLPLAKPQTELLTILCAGRSKLVFMDNLGHHAIINADLGKWSRGAWYSDGGEILEPEVKSAYSWTNTNYRAPAPASYPPRGSGPHSGYSTYGGDPADAEMLAGPEDDNDIGAAESKSLPVGKKPLPLIKPAGGIGARPSAMMAPQQRADMLCAKLRVKRFIDIDGGTLTGPDWREWHNVRALLVS